MLEQEVYKIHEPSQGELKHAASKLDIFFLGVTIVIGGQMFSWNEGLKAGFWPFFGCLLLTAVGYLCVIFCLAEMVSALPFSGGAYGFIRVALGPYLGFVVGCFEVIVNILYVASAVYPFGQIITMTTGWEDKYEPLYWLLFFLTAITIHCLNAKWFWRFSNIFAITSALMILIYLLSTAQFLDLEKYTQGSQEWDDDTYKENIAVRFFRELPLASWFYIGIELLPLASRECSKPRETIPPAMISCMVFLIISSLFVFFFVSSQHPGIGPLSSALLPYNYGYSRALKVGENSDFSYLSLVGIYTTAYGFMFGYSRQISSMASSGLVPSILATYTVGDRNCPLLAYLSGSLISYCFLLIVFYFMKELSKLLFLVCASINYIVYICILISYLRFHNKYGSLRRGFYSPVGTSAAWLGIVIFTLDLISASFLQKSKFNYKAIAIISGYALLVSIYYFVYARKIQMFSDEERKVLFPAYVINANQRSRNKTRRNNNMADLQKRANRYGVSFTSTHSSSHHSEVSDENSNSVSSHQNSSQIIAKKQQIAVTAQISTQDNSESNNDSVDEDENHLDPPTFTNNTLPCVKEERDSVSNGSIQSSREKGSNFDNLKSDHDVESNGSSSLAEKIFKTLASFSLDNDVETKVMLKPENGFALNIKNRTTSRSFLTTFQNQILPLIVDEEFEENADKMIVDSIPVRNVEDKA